MAKKRTYYTLVSIDGSPGCLWSPEFGDYDRQTVWDEYLEMRDRGWKRSELNIIETGETQAEIDAAVAELNKDI